jgi:hypothetical protein
MIRYTAGEQFTRGRLLLQGSRRAQLGLRTARIDRALDVIDQRAAERTQRAVAAAEALVERVRNDVAAAEARLRAARPPDRADARRAWQQARQDLRRAETAARRTR